MRVEKCVTKYLARANQNPLRDPGQSSQSMAEQDNAAQRDLHYQERDAQKLSVR